MSLALAAIDPRVPSALGCRIGYGKPTQYSGHAFGGALFL